MNTKRFLLLLVLGWCYPAIALAHVGSPNVFFEGNAGPHALRVIIRPPRTLPGLAQVDIRLAEGSPARISVRSVLGGTSLDTAPPPVEAARVAGESRVYSAGLWLLRPGTYRIEVGVQGVEGEGTARIPLTAAPIDRPSMPMHLRYVLGALGLLLVGSGVAIARGAASAPSPEDTKPNRRRGRWAAAIVFVIFAGAISGGAIRWQHLHRAFIADSLWEPVSVTASIVTRGSLHRMVLTPNAAGLGQPDWDSLVADHGKLLHLFLVRLPKADAFAHLHPARINAGRFEAVLPPLPAGEYEIYAEATYETGLGQTLVGRVTLPPPLGVATQPTWTILDEAWCQLPLAVSSITAQPRALEVDDSWQIGTDAAASARVSAIPGAGTQIVLETPGPFVADQEVVLRFKVIDQSGRAKSVQPYMGMRGHAVVRRAEGDVFTHLHPVGSISMAAQSLVSGAPTASAMPVENMSGESVTFPYAFPKAGTYRTWVQVRIDGKVVTGVFDLAVEEQ